MEHQNILHTLAVVGGTAALIFVGLWLFGGTLLPFVFGAAAAAAAEPVVRRLRLPRWASSAVVVGGLYVALAAVLWLLCRLLCTEVTAWTGKLPQLVESLAEPVAALRERLLRLADRFPDGVGAAMRESVLSLFRNGSGLTEKLYSRVFDAATALLKRLPELMLFLITALLSGFMISAQLPRLQKLWRERVPAAWQQGVSAVAHRLKTALGGWCKAQIKLMGVTFFVLTTGFLLLSVDSAFLWGLSISLLDALPVLGVGTVLIPWGLWMFVQGRTGMGVGLVCLYGAAALLRTALEPRLLGKQIGLDPLLTLLTIYAGYRFFGVAGMILFPVGAILCKQYWSHMERKGEM